MRFSLLFLFLAAGCTDKSKSNQLIQNDWHVVQIIDGKNPSGSPMSMNYQYRMGDSLRSIIYFINDTNYVVRDLFERSVDTNYFELRGDTLITNREPRDYLVVAKGEKDSMFLINQSEQLVFTLVKAH